MRNSLLLTFCLLGTSASLHAQSDIHLTTEPSEGFNCLANNPVELQRHLDEHPNALEAAMQAKAYLDAHTRGFIRAAGARSQYVIPVVVHIIHDNGPENISNAQVYDAIRILNEDFNKLNPDWTTVRPEFLDLVADVGIEFRLARKDPQGNCTNGITRTVSAQTYMGDFEMTQLIQWPRDRYMNVWVCVDPMGAAGYTYYPEWLDGWPEADGMVMRHDYLGSIGTGTASRSRVWGHEVGHWLNLKHCWGDSNEPGDESNCFMDDEVDDTPLTRGWTSCFLQGSSCGSSLDNVQNYMEYSYCAKMFTVGQSARMISALTSPIAQRSDLWQAGNLDATGVSGDGALCAVNFGHGDTEICQGNTILFHDESYHNIQSRTWSFPGGTPSSSTAAQPSITYSVPGSYPVTLSVFDGITMLELVRPALVNVLPDPGNAVPFSEDFEDDQWANNANWVVRNPDNDNAFEVTEQASFGGLRSLRLSNTPSMDGSKDDLVSTTFDMSSASAIRITYRYAFAQRNGSNDDRLRVYVSRDCGNTWSLRQQLRGSTSLPTAGANNGDFIPLGQEQWALAEISNISSAFHSADFRVRFEFESNGGNNLYLDDININGLPVGLAEAPIMLSNAMVVPNPAGKLAQLVLNMEVGGLVGVRILDALGRLAWVDPERLHPSGPSRWDLPTAGLPAGPYVLLIQTNKGQLAIRFIVE